MEEVVINKNDELVMKLLHYFITEIGYSPIVLHGAKDEIWLEKLDGSYQIVRIVSNYIHNNDQLDFDIYKTKQIMKKIKKKTFSLNMNTLSLFVNLGENVQISNYDNLGTIYCADVKTEKDLNKYDFILNEFPTITKETKFKEKGIELFMKITEDITKRNEKENKKAEEVFKMKKPIITYIIMAINILIFLLGHLDITILDNLFLYKFTGIEHYRLITAAFCHYDIFHLIFNMYALYIIGPQIESFFGKLKFSFIYLFSAISGSLMSLTFMADNGGSLGASGAIFGLFGSLMYFGYHYRLYLGNVIKSQIIPLILINLLFGFINTGVDNSAHIGGLIGGLFISMAVGVKYKSSKSEKINGFVLSTILTLFLVYTAFVNI